jgi:hypothetical protein
MCRKFIQIGANRPDKETLFPLRRTRAALLPSTAACDQHVAALIPLCVLWCALHCHTQVVIYFLGRLK